MCRGTGIRSFTPLRHLRLREARLDAHANLHPGPPSSFTIGITLNGRLTASVTRYFISSNSPSGGTNEMVLSAENFERFTH